MNKRYAQGMAVILFCLFVSTLAVADEFKSGEPIFQRHELLPISYPTDPTSDITWSCGKSSVADVQCAFNAARVTENTQLGTTVPMLSMPSESTWNSMSDNEKAL